MIKRIVIVILIALLIPAPAYGSTHHRYKIYKTNLTKGLKHQKIKKVYKGSVLVYNP